MNENKEIIVKMSNGEYFETCQVDVSGMEAFTVEDFNEATKYKSEQSAKDELDLVVKGKVHAYFDINVVVFEKFVELETRLID